MSEEPPTTTPTQEAVARPLQRTWPTWVTMFVILPIGTIAFSAVALIIGALVTGGPNLADPDALQNWLAEISKSPLGILILVAPGQIFFLVLSLGSALPSSEPLTKRLGITAPRYSPRTWAGRRMIRNKLYGCSVTMKRYNRSPVGFLQSTVSD